MLHFLGHVFVAVCLVFSSVPALAVTITPGSASVQEGSTKQFTASTPSQWKTSCGSVSSSGLFKAPLYPTATCTVTASATNGSGNASAQIAVVSPITITPSAPKVAQGSTQQFTANMPVNWIAKCGTITSAGLYTASATAGTHCTIEPIASASPQYTAYGYATITQTAAQTVLTVSPANPTVMEGATQQFAASSTAIYSSSCGTISSSGLFTAPIAPGSCTITATATDGSGQKASTAVAVKSPITITPSGGTVHALNSLSFTASQAVTWSASCGSVSSTGLFKAPASAGTCKVTAKASTGTAYTAQVTANVDVVNYTAWKGGGGTTGAQTREFRLAPSNVNATSFGVIWNANVDGWVSGQPLYMNGLTVNGSAHNVVFVATANDSVYALDGDTGSQLWHVSLIPAGATSVSGTTVGMKSAPFIGILSTPVIDTSTNTLYLVTETSEQDATYVPHRLHALDLATGKEKLGGPVLISHPDMAPMHKLQRPGLTLANGNVYIAIGSLQDIDPYHGLLFAFNAKTLAQEAVWESTPSGSEGGIWMAGAAPSVDENGNLYVSVGDGTFDGTTNFGEAVVKLSPDLQVLDYFAPYNLSSYNSSNIDLGSGNAMVVPAQNGSHPHELIVCGKPTPVYVLDRDNMGKAGTTSDNVIQRLDNQVGRLGPNATTLMACFTSPAMWNQKVYFGGKYDAIKMFTLNASTGLLSSTPASQDTFTYDYPGAEPVISANGTNHGIVWAIDTGTDTLRANDASDVSKELYSGSLGAQAVRWSVPTVVNGHVYVGTQGKVVAFGLH